MAIGVSVGAEDASPMAALASGAATEAAAPGFVTSCFEHPQANATIVARASTQGCAMGETVARTAAQTATRLDVPRQLALRAVMAKRNRHSAADSWNSCCGTPLPKLISKRHEPALRRVLAERRGEEG